MQTIGKPVGANSKGDLKDIKTVETLLRNAGLLAPAGPISEQQFVEAIRTFQKAIGIAAQTGRVEPGGATLRNLQQITQPLRLGPITPDRISRGGYKLKVDPFIPRAPYRVLLGFSSSETDCIDITRCNASDVFDTELLEQLLPIIQRLNCWGTIKTIRAFVRINQRSISESASASLPCPVHPHNGKLLPLDEDKNGPKLSYLGDSATGPFYGRMLVYSAALKSYLFKYGGVLETSPAKRGFDCITYCGSVCGAATTHMAEAGDMAAHLNATQVEFEVVASGGSSAAKSTKVKLEGADPKLVKQFFETDRPDQYLMWSGGHVVLVKDNTVHEFAYSKKGYAATNVKSWLAPYSKQKLTVRKVALPISPAP